MVMVMGEGAVVVGPRVMVTATAGEHEGRTG